MKGGGFSRAIDHVGTAALGCPAEQSSADFVSLPDVARLGSGAKYFKLTSPSALLSLT